MSGGLESSPLFSYLTGRRIRWISGYRNRIRSLGIPYSELISFRSRNTGQTSSKDDFKTVCTFNQSNMTSEIVRFINNYISQESIRLKQYQVSSKELNELKQRKLTTTTSIRRVQIKSK